MRANAATRVAAARRVRGDNICARRQREPREAENAHALQQRRGRKRSRAAWRGKEMSSLKGARAGEAPRAVASRRAMRTRAIIDSHSARPVHRRRPPRFVHVVVVVITPSTPRHALCRLPSLSLVVLSSFFVHGKGKESSITKEEMQTKVNKCGQQSGAPRTCLR